MKDMSYLCDKKHILPAAIRKGYKVGGTITSMGLLCFALFMLYCGIKQDTDKTSCFTIAIIFGMLFIGYLMIWVKNYHLMDAKYYADGFIVVNCVDKMHVKTSIDLRSAVCINYKHSFYLGKAGFDVDYIIFSDNIHSASMVSNFDGYNIYKTLKKVWESGSVIVPKKTGDGSLS